MMLYRNPALVRWIWPKRLWRMPAKEKVLYLTFDDGPTPGVTDFVMDQLELHGGKGTFFVVGEQAGRHPELLRAVADRGHRVGNHSHHHLNGFQVPSGTYLADVAEAQEKITEILGSASDLYRPPYGRLRNRDAHHLLKKYQVVMWDVLAGDWKSDLGHHRIAEKVTRLARPGSIVVFHDSEKAAENVKKALPTVLNYFAEAGYVFRAIP